MSPVPSIGDSPTVALKKLQETYPLPKTRKEVVTAFERILNLGGVHRVVVELGAPIKVVRVAEAGAEVPEELQDDDLVAAARNSPMEEFVFSESILPTNYLFRAFHLLTQRRLKATAMVVNNYVSMRDWLGVDKAFDVSEVFGVPVKTHKEIPDGVLLVVAAPIDDDVISFSLRLEMSQEKKP
jgi:hypothetical protein